MHELKEPITIMNKKSITTIKINIKETWKHKIALEEIKFQQWFINTKESKTRI